MAASKINITAMSTDGNCCFCIVNCFDAKIGNNCFVRSGPENEFLAISFIAADSQMYLRICG